MNQTDTQNNVAALSTHVDRLLREHFGSQDGQLQLAGVTVGEQLHPTPRGLRLKL